MIWKGFYKIDIQATTKHTKDRLLTLRLQHSASVNILGIEILKTKRNQRISIFTGENHNIMQNLKGEISRDQQPQDCVWIMDNPSRGWIPTRQVWDLVQCLRQGEVRKKKKIKSINAGSSCPSRSPKVQHKGKLGAF